MEHQREMTKRRLARALRDILAQWRERELARTPQARCHETAEVVTVPGDEVDLASSIAEREMCASLDARHQTRLKALDAAFERLQQGLYGICEQCAEEIPLERLRVLPFAPNCVDCQTERDTESRRTLGGDRWAAPLKFEELFDTERSVEDAGSHLNILSGHAFDPDKKERKNASNSALPARAGTKARARASSIERSVKRWQVHSAGIGRGRLVNKAS